MEYFKIGKVAGTHGVAGKLVIQHSLGKRSDFDQVEALFFEEGRDAFLPWFVQKAQAKSDYETFVELEGVESKEAARKLLKKEVWLRDEDFKRLADSTAAISLLGFHVIDNKVDLGEIVEVIEQPHQTLCKILIDNKEAWIPVHEDSLQKLDRKNKRVFVALPDGLLDVYR